MGGNNSRIEEETLIGNLNDKYSIKDRSNDVYAISESDKNKLNGSFDKNKTIAITYNYKGTEETLKVSIKPKTSSLKVGDTVKYSVELEPVIKPSNVEYEIVDCNQCVQLVGDTLTAINTGGAVIRVNVTHEGKNYSDTATVIVTNMDKE